MRGKLSSICAALKRLPPVVWLGLAVPALMGLMLLVLHSRQWLVQRFETTSNLHLVAGPQDHESAHFALCRGPERYSCVIDGDTIWYRGNKIRLADINAPETSEPACDAELDLGEKATDRMMELLNEGRFSLVPLHGPVVRDRDVYGRELRSIMRGGHSLGEVLVAEGLAERWVGFRRDWCDDGPPPRQTQN